MESAKRKLWKFKFYITQKKHFNITHNSVPTTNERAIISEDKYVLSGSIAGFSSVFVSEFSSEDIFLKKCMQ